MADEFGFDSVFDAGDSAGVNEPEAAEPDENGEITGEEEPEAAEPDEDSSESENEQQSAAENAKYAAARRKAEAERDAAIARARDEMTGSIKALGIVDPYTGQPVEDMETLKRWAEGLRSEQAREAEHKLTDAGLTKKEIDELVNAHPDVVNARQEQARLKQLEDEAETKKLSRLFEEELAEIGKWDPNIKSFDDLQGVEHKEAMEEMIRHGYKISDAYFLAHRDAITQRQIDAAKQETRNSVANRGHLEHSASRGTGGVDVPDNVMAQFREMMPDATKAEIQKFYERDQRRIAKKKG